LGALAVACKEPVELLPFDINDREDARELYGGLVGSAGAK
jgi:hypothetical protein